MDWEAELAFQIKAAGLAKPEREWMFHPQRKWRLDFAWPRFLVGCEVHGGIFGTSKGGPGRHTRGGGFEKDREKMNEAIILGWRVIEVTPGQIKSGMALKWLEALLPK